jgi:hypothetical protein
MKGPISFSLADELRAIRGGSNSRKSFKRAPDHNDEGAPWQAEMERMQHSFQEVLQAISQLSGVELPGVSSTSPGNPDSPPRLDCNTLKDRIRNDLEAFSVRTASELSQQAEEHTRAALGAVQNELSSQIEQTASQLREKLQGPVDTEQMGTEAAQQTKDRVAALVKTQTDEFARWVWLTCKGTDTPTPPQIQKLLEPYIEEATSNFAAPLRQKVGDLIAEQEQLVQQKLQTAAESAQKKLNSLEENSLQVCQQGADAVARQSAERLNALADESVKGLESRIAAEIEGAVCRFQTRLAETSTATEKDLQRDQDVWAENLRQRLGELAVAAHENSTTEISTRLAQTAADLIESSAQHLHHQTEDALEHSREEISAFMKLEMAEVQHQLHDLGMTAHRELDQELGAASNRHILTCRQQLDSMVRESMESMGERIHQAADQHLQEAGRVSGDSQGAPQSQEAVDSRFNSLVERLQQEADQAAQRVATGAKAASESLMCELSNKTSASVAALREEADQAARRIESSLQQSLEAYQQQLAQITQAGLEQQQKAMSGNVVEIHNRLKQVAEMLNVCSTSAR